MSGKNPLAKADFLYYYSSGFQAGLDSFFCNMIAAIVLMLLMAFDFGYVLSRHGEEKKFPYNKYNAYTNLIDKAIVIFLLHMSGFFQVFK